MREESFLQNILVTTKLFVPALPARLIPRLRLIETLNQGLERKLTLVSAPAGFGKTTLAAKWLHLKKADEAARTNPTKPNTLPFKAAWVSLDESDNELYLFWKYVVTALEYSQPGLGAPLLDQLQRAVDQPIQPILTNLINRVLECDQPFALVLDDYHHITEPEIHSSLSYLLDHLPPQLHIFVLTRNEPPLPLSRLRARGQMLELDANMLCCTLEETDQFLSEVMKVNLPDRVVQEVFNRTEGWLVGLQLLGLSLQRQEATVEVLEDLNGRQRYILDYLTQEVLHQQPPEVQTFLVYTSSLPQFCGSLCDTVLGRTDSQVVLNYLELANLFIIKLAGQPGWYRYHRLFAETLRYHLDNLGSETVRNLHELATRWYTKQEQRPETIKYIQDRSEPINRSELASYNIGPNNHSLLEPKQKVVAQGTALPLSNNLPMLIESLSERELEVLNLLTLGTANQDIAAQLTVSLNTVKKHTSNIFSKMGVPNRTQAVYLGRKLGLIVE